MTRLFGITGWSGSGKTTLLKRLIPVLRAQGLTVSTIKHAHHRFDLDQPGKDSWEHREAGAMEVLVASPHRWALQHELRGAPEPSLGELLQRLAPVDLVLIEGFKRDRHPKLEIYRPSLGHPPLFPDDQTIRAVAAFEPPLLDIVLPRYDADDVEAIAGCVLREARPWEWDT